MLINFTASFAAGLGSLLPDDLAFLKLDPFITYPCINFSGSIKKKMGRPGRGLPKEEVDELYSLTHGSMLNTIVQTGSNFRLSTT